MKELKLQVSDKTMRQLEKESKRLESPREAVATMVLGRWADLMRDLNDDWEDGAGEKDEIDPQIHLRADVETLHLQGLDFVEGLGKKRLVERADMTCLPCERLLKRLTPLVGKECRFTTIHFAERGNKSIPVCPEHEPLVELGYATHRERVLKREQDRLRAEGER